MVYKYAESNRNRKFYVENVDPTQYQYIPDINKIVRPFPFLPIL